MTFIQPKPIPKSPNISKPSASYEEVVREKFVVRDIMDSEEWKKDKEHLETLITSIREPNDLSVFNSQLREKLDNFGKDPSKTMDEQIDELTLSIQEANQMQEQSSGGDLQKVLAHIEDMEKRWDIGARIPGMLSSLKERFAELISEYEKATEKTSIETLKEAMRKVVTSHFNRLYNAPQYGNWEIPKAPEIKEKEEEKDSKMEVEDKSGDQLDEKHTTSASAGSLSSFASGSASTVKPRT